MRTLHKIILGLCLLPALSGRMQAQNADDAFRYSFTGITGTTRYTSMGGAFGALGGDASVASYNPAGIGVYRRSEITFTPSFFYQNVTSNFKNQVAEDFKYNFNIGNFGYIGKIDHYNTTGEGWISSSFGITYNRINNFHSNVLIEGKNSQSSLLDVWYNQAAVINGKQNPSNLDPFGAGLAWETYLLDTIPTDTVNNLPWEYYSQISSPNMGNLQRKAMNMTGSMAETAISYAGNYSNKLFIGASIGFPTIRFRYNSIHTEEVNPQDTNSILKSFNYREDLYTRGNGFNFKVGVIYRLNDYVRLGGALHTPTFYSLSDSWSSRISANYINGATLQYDSPNGSFNYSLNTPMRAIGSLAFVIAQKGLISADYEFVDYSNMRLRSNTYKFFDENDDIRRSYSAAGILRVGAEYRAEPFALRVGYANWANAYRPNVANNSSRNDFSFGLGIREKEYYIDFAYLISISNSSYYIYDPGLVSATKLNTTNNHFMVTIGFRY
ncbi:MAG: OmpP1/FadL family transporter [Bacteroidia bacterium]